MNDQLNKLQNKVILKINSLTVKNQKKFVEDKRITALPKDVW